MTQCAGCGDTPLPAQAIQFDLTQDPNKDSMLPRNSVANAQVTVVNHKL